MTYQQVTIHDETHLSTQTTPALSLSEISLCQQLRWSGNEEFYLQQDC